MEKRKRLAALLCAVMMALTLLPVQAWATEEGALYTARYDAVTGQMRRERLPEGTVLSVVLRETPSADNGVTAELLASCFDRVYVMPDADASALPTGYDRATRVVTMAGYAPESGSYLVTQ